MDVFAFRDQLVNEYERFSRSFTKIRAADISDAVDKEYADGRFWPDPLIQLNPKFAPGGYVDELVAQGILDRECARIFRIKKPDNLSGDPLLLHRHQADAIKAAGRGESYVLTTGTGSGKSLGYFIPIVNDVLRRKRAGGAGAGISAIVIYPMNALCNSQCEELKRYLRQGFGKGEESVTFARYTGQETQEEREQIAKNPPDILLTNFVMLELLMTRFHETDKAIRKHADGLRFLVLDELHVYRGRQGADVAMLIRRVRERFNPDLLCVGTSATMSTDGSLGQRNVAVAGVASRLFGVTIDPGNIVSETLQRVTTVGAEPGQPELRDAVTQGVPKHLTHQELSKHPVAAWVERNLGVEECDGKLVRIVRPLTLRQAAGRLAATTDLSAGECRSYLREFLLTAHLCRNPGGVGFFAFRLHQFISGAWNAYSTFEAPGERHVTLQGQTFMPGDRNRRMWPLCFCRACGQEYFPVWASLAGKQIESFAPRDLSERSGDEDGIQYGYLMPDPSRNFDPTDLRSQFPEDWLEFRGDQVRLKSHYRARSPMDVRVTPLGKIDTGGLPSWFIPEAFRFCLNPECDAQFGGSTRSELTKLSALSSEGRSSATTILVLSALKYLIGVDLDAQTKKILAFTDNRQDASLQAGHFNDFVQILLLRSALLAAIRGSAGGRLTDEVLTQRVLKHLQLRPEEYATNFDAKGIKQEETRKTLRNVLGYRLYFDLQRGWRVTNPNLEQLQLLEIGYRDLDACCGDQVEWGQKHPLLASASPECRRKVVTGLLERMRRALCIKTIYLDSSFQERVRNQSYNQLKEPWGLSEDERMESHCYMVARPRRGGHQRQFRIFHISHRSEFGRTIMRQGVWGDDNPGFPSKFTEEVYNQVVDDILQVLTTYGYVEPTSLIEDLTGYRIDSSVFEWREAAEAADTGTAQSATNAFFRDLYRNTANFLDGDDRFLHQLEAREHTAQVDAEVREDRERRFRKGLEPSGLPILFCTPTMELGVDISTLNTVYLRNMPPTPANYAQRSGRAGRSGQPALVVAYCAARSPHDQWFFSDPRRMVAGVVSPPSIDLANEELIRSHLHAVWLAETGVNLGTSVRDVIDLDRRADLPLREEVVEQTDATRALQVASGRANRILATAEADLSPANAPWYTDTWLDSTINSARQRLGSAFSRWRSLYRATASQMGVAKAILDNAAASEQDRKAALARFNEATNQQNLLLDPRRNTNSDFNTYRYLAAEGFLPGYNFPRLPLLAFVPGRRETVIRDSFLSRPRFLGLSEFGPQSIIYHEGSTYRVRRAILSMRDESDVTASAKLPVQVARICPVCGYGHFGEQSDYERCVNCDERLDDGRWIRNLYRIEQVSTQRTNRITSDEEERQRQGYEMVTTLRFSEKMGRLHVNRTVIADHGEALLELGYGPAATLWRINLGWRRRKEKSIHGFSMDANTGEWSRDSQAPTDAEDDAVRDGKTVQRITPFVEDTRNALLLRPMAGLDETAMVSFQFALKRTIEKEFQLEESELASELLPDRTNPRTILFYEASEGGAGVLSRLANDPRALPMVARGALDLCHFRIPSGEHLSPSDLEDCNADCEAGCYRCLLSYYNQPEHSKIDRKNPEMLDLLCRLTRATRQEAGSPLAAGDSLAELQSASSSSLEKKWLRFVEANGYRLPDQGQHYLEALSTRPDFAYTDLQTLIYIDGPHHHQPRQRERDAGVNRRLRDAGYTVVRFPVDQSQWHGIVDEFAWVFGPAAPTP